MHSIVALFIVYLVLPTNSHDVNYCGAKMCGYTNKHTFCQYSSGPNPFCVGQSPAFLTPEEKARILARLNLRRNEVASGKLRGLPSAGNMLKMHWIEELAKEAQLWADQCRPQKTPEEHDTCRDLYSITVGQCVATVVGESPGLRVESMVDIWLMQSKFFKGNVTLYEPSQSSKQYYGDFTQIMWARTFMVGCGRSRFMVSNHNHQPILKNILTLTIRLPVKGRLRTIERLVCNFAPQGPVPYQSLWTVGVPATACPSRSRPSGVWTSLCEFQKELNEAKDIDASMTIEDHILLNALLEINTNEILFDGSLDEMYLTYLAIVTMQNTDATTSHYNSIHKRDIIEKIIIPDDRIKPITLIQYSETQTHPNSTTTHVTKKLPKKLKIIGRPKAYKLEELSNTGGNHRVKNHDVTEAVLNRKKDFYYEYMMDTFDENITIATERNMFDSDLNENYTFEDHTYKIVPMTMNATVTVILPDVTKLVPDEKVEMKIIPTKINSTTAAKEFMTSKDNLVDDYLTDPETVRQLQEALDRMEHESGPSNSTKKARRDIRNTDNSDEQDEPNDVTLLTDEPLHSFNLLDAPGVSTHPPEQAGKNSSETAPVLSMFFKYMPYLKQYENEILTPKNSANSVCSSVILMLIVLRV